MTEHDLLEVVEIEEECGLSTWGWGAYYAELQNKDLSLMLVARLGRVKEGDQGNSLVGYIAARLSADELHINNVAVRHDYRRHGIGSALLRTSLGEGERSGARLALLEVRAGNLTARALYEQCGFRMVGRRPNYYSQPREDAVIMSISLEQHP